MEGKNWRWVQIVLAMWRSRFSIRNNVIKAWPGHSMPSGQGTKRRPKNLWKKQDGLQRGLGGYSFIPGKQFQNL
jgi:hypothetical protein